MVKKLDSHSQRVLRVERLQLPEVFQHCNKCKTETVHQREVEKKTLTCINCKTGTKYA